MADVARREHLGLSSRHEARMGAGRAALREQQDYYAARAAEYDDAYRRSGGFDRGSDANARWQADLALLVEAFEKVDLSGDVVELAAGSGFWTERIVGRARSLSVIDGSAEMVAMNRARLGPTAARVDYQIADLFEWRPKRSWDACAFGFWLCHVPDDRVAEFLNTVFDSLRRGGVVCFVDKAATSEPPTERVERALNDGRRFTIFDHPRTPKRLVELFAAAHIEVAIETIRDRFCLGHGTRSSLA
jgi:SAM-dependent methyltransferase